MGVLAQSIATLSRTSRTPKRWRRCLTTSSSSLPTFLANCLPSLVMTSRASGCQPPRVSTARGRKVMPSPSHLAPYFLSFSWWACSTAELPSSEAAEAQRSVFSHKSAAKFCDNILKLLVGQRLFETFPKIHLFGTRRLPLKRPCSFFIDFHKIQRKPILIMHISPIFFIISTISRASK